MKRYKIVVFERMVVLYEMTPIDTLYHMGSRAGADVVRNIRAAMNDAAAWGADEIHFEARTR